jgi:VWFA-related protein
MARNPMYSIRRRCPREAAALALAALLLAPPLDAQKNQAASSDETFFETMDVSVVNVDVYVTDRAGNPVHGLTQNDFVVYEDGKPVEVTNFYAAEGGRIEGEAPAAGGEPAAAAAVPRDVPAEQRLHLAVYLDNYNLTPRARNQALKSLQSFLATRVQVEDRVLLVSYDGPGSLKVRQAATNDAAALVRTLEELAGTAAGSARNSARDQIQRDIDNSSHPNDANIQSDSERQFATADAEALYDRILLYAQREHQEARASLDALGRFVDSLAGVPGRKALVYVSGGVSLRPAEALFDSWAERFTTFSSGNSLKNSSSARQDAMDYDATPLLERLAARANASRVTLYSLGAADDPMGVSSESGGAAFASRGATNLEHVNQNHSLTLLAAATGGIATTTEASAGALLNNLRRDLDSYYSLGYTPTQRKTGKDRKLKVETRDKSHKLRYRESYRDRTAQERMGEQTLSALVLGAGENPMGVAVEFEQEAKKGKDLQLTLLVKFPMSALVLLPQEKFHEGRVTVFVGARDGQGRVSDLTQIAIPVRVPNDQVLAAMGQTVAYRTSLVLRNESHTVAVGVRDEIGNQGSTVTAAYSPGQAPPATAAATADRSGSR